MPSSRGPGGTASGACVWSKIGNGTSVGISGLDSAAPVSHDHQDIRAPPAIRKNKPRPPPTTFPWLHSERKGSQGKERKLATGHTLTQPLIEKRLRQHPPPAKPSRWRLESMSQRAWPGLTGRQKIVHENAPATPLIVMRPIPAWRTPSSSCDAFDLADFAGLSG